MAEQKNIRHSKKVSQIWKSSEYTIWQKIKELLFEIAIIVFSVSLSIWLHSWNEHNNQQDEIKVFLLGLKEDLTNDIKEMEADKDSYKKSQQAFNYILKNNEISKINKDSLNKHIVWMGNTTGLVANSGRFEGFKLSGKIGNIENTKLQNDIMDLYQENIPMLIGNTDNYSMRKIKLMEYVQDNMTMDKDNKSNLPSLLLSNKVQNRARSFINISFIVKRYDECIAKNKMIISEINAEYKD